MYVGFANKDPNHTREYISHISICTAEGAGIKEPPGAQGHFPSSLSAAPLAAATTAAYVSSSLGQVGLQGLVTVV